MSIARGSLGIITLAGCVVVPASASAQIHGIGLRLGLGRATQVSGFYDLVNDVGGKTESRTGFVAGAYIDYGHSALPAPLSIQAGVDLTQKGARIPPEDGLTQRRVDITYLDVPVLAKGTFESGPYRPYAVAGPVMSLMLSATGEVDGEEFDAADQLKGLDLGFGLGAGARRGPIGIELRYVLGLSNISESSDPDEGARNRHWALVGTYEFPRLR